MKDTAHNKVNARHGKFFDESMLELEEIIQEMDN